MEGFSFEYVIELFKMNISLIVTRELKTRDSGAQERRWGAPTGSTGEEALVGDSDGKHQIWGAPKYGEY